MYVIDKGRLTIYMGRDMVSYSSSCGKQTESFGGFELSFVDFVEWK